MLPGFADFRRKSTESFALTPHTPQPKAGSKRERWDKAKPKSLDAAANKISVGFYKKRCKPWVFVSFGPSQKKEPLGGGEPRQAPSQGKENSDCIKIPACAGMTDLLMEQRLFTTPAPPKSGGGFPS